MTLSPLFIKTCILLNELKQKLLFSDLVTFIFQNSKQCTNMEM